MRALIQFYKEGKMVDSKICRTKKEAREEKRKYESSVTVHNRVKFDIHAIIS